MSKAAADYFLRREGRREGRAEARPVGGGDVAGGACCML